MSIFNNGNFAKPFNVPQPHLNSSDRTAHLKSKTKYAAAVNLAKNGGVLTKRDGSKYVGPVHTTSTTMTSADSYSDLLDVTKGKYLLTPPPSSNLDTSFSPASGDVFYGSFTVTDYAEANIPVTMLGAPGVTAGAYVNPNKLVAVTTPPPPFNNTSIVVDPEYRLFYGKKTCGMRDYFKNVRIDPNADVRWTADGVVHSSRPYNQQQAQRILAHEAQRLRGFQYPARVHLDLDNCESKPSITPVAPDAPVIYISSQTLTSDEPSELFTVTVAWPHGFDGGSPITSYTVITSTGESYTVDPQPCLNSYTLTNVALTTQIWVTASNCIPQSTWPSSAPAPHCTPTTSPKSNPVTPNPPPLPTITVAFSSGPNPMPYEPGKVITMTITSDNPMPFSVMSSELGGLASPPDSGSGTRALTTTNGYSITLLRDKNPAARTPISVSFMQASGGGYSRGYATATLVILPALPPQIVFKLNGSSATTLTVQYSPNAVPIPMTISSNYPVAPTAYQATIIYSGTDSGYAQVASGNTGIQLLKNPSIPTTVTIKVTQPGTLNYPQGTATATLTIVRGQTLVQTTLDIAGFTSQDYTMQYLDSTGANPSQTTPYSNGYTVYKFYPTSTKSGTIKPTSKITNLSYLVIGGGGGGGNASDQASGGGGAGGFVTNYPSGSTVALQSTQTYGLTIGGGGASNTAGTASSLAHDNGVVTASGGGCGGNANQTGGNGASGGGGGGGSTYNSQDGTYITYVGGSATQGTQGYAGGSGVGTYAVLGNKVTYYAGGGGGGAGGAGVGGAGGYNGGLGSGTGIGGGGGNGLQSSIYGTATMYAGGGGGGGPSNNEVVYGNSVNGGMGGSGVGGRGTPNTGSPGTSGTGSGGGGGYNYGPGGAGGSGIIILRFPSWGN